jgi:2,4-dienoyl-CoA reductase-like NADH-dependent reductase (Old Yellow Enzyme family)
MAKAECGLIIPGAVYHMKSGKSASLQNGMSTEFHANAWKSTVDEIHSYGSKIIFQVCHSGINASPEVSPPKCPSALKLNSK